MRRFCLFLALVAALLLAPKTSRAGDAETQIHLITMGPGDHLYTRGGHAALMVAQVEDGVPRRTTIYNYGDTDWDNPFLVPQFLRGNLIFFLTESDSLLQTVNEYGVRQGRTVFRQRLNLSPEQAAEVAKRLKEGIAVGKREYVFHHIRALCSTRITDLLDDVLQGRVRAELASQPGPRTGRDFHEVIFSGHYLTSIAADLFLGRIHDHVLNKYETMASPEHMSEYLQKIMVPAPSGAKEMVPLADPPVALVERKEPLVLEKSWFTHILWGACIALLLGYGVSAYRKVGSAPEQAADVVFPAAITSGIVGLILLGFIVLSRVPEFRWNELILLFWPMDLWLAWRIRRFIKKRIALDGWVQRYCHARLAFAALAVLGHLTGLLYQKPRILLALGVVEAAVVWALVRALRRLAAAGEDATKAPSEAPAEA
jgi:hypothetical protein